MLTQPNFSWFGKRTWKILPYSLGLLNASLKKAGHDSWIFDPNFQELSEEAIRNELRKMSPGVVGISTCSSEYDREVLWFSQVVKEELPRAVVILGGVFPTVFLEEAIKNPNIDYFMLGEGDRRLSELLDGSLIADRHVVIQPAKFIFDLDALEFPDYGGLDFDAYAHHAQRYAHLLLPKRFPFATTMTSRGCPYGCIFCSSSLVSGKAVRVRSASNVLQEIDVLCENHGIQEIIFLDDSFLARRQRVLDIAEGLRDRGLFWKCVNLNAWHLDEYLLELMRKSGCYQLNLSIESGSQRVLRDIIGKPFFLNKLPSILTAAKKLDFDITSNFVIGLPGESWDELRETFQFAENIDIDEVKFHVATPLPGTKMMTLCREKGYLKIESGQDMSGFTKCAIETPDFTSIELQILRAFEWDRINFSSEKKKRKIAEMEGISMEELEQWRLNTRRDRGVLLPRSKTLV